MIPCRKCKIAHPRTDEYWGRHHQSPDGFAKTCRACDTRGGKGQAKPDPIPVDPSTCTDRRTLGHCYACDQWFEVVDGFYTNKRTSHGHDSACRKCRRVIRRDSYNRNREAQYERNLLPRNKLWGYKQGAKSRNLEWTLTDNQFMALWQVPCHYCGEPIDTIGLDRLDNTKGYTPDNVGTCCFTCNRMKGNMTTDEWLAHIRKVVNQIDQMP